MINIVKMMGSEKNEGQMLVHYRVLPTRGQITGRLLFPIATHGRGTTRLYSALFYDSIFSRKSKNNMKNGGGGESTVILRNCAALGKPLFLLKNEA